MGLSKRLARKKVPSDLDEEIEEFADQADAFEGPEHDQIVAAAEVLQDALEKAKNPPKKPKKSKKKASKPAEKPIPEQSKEGSIFDLGQFWWAVLILGIVAMAFVAYHNCFNRKSEAVVAAPERPRSPRADIEAPRAAPVRPVVRRIKAASPPVDIEAPQMEIDAQGNQRLGI